MPPTGLKGSQRNRVRANALAIQNANPTTITLRRDGVDLSPQSVLIGGPGAPSESRGANVTVANAGVRIYGPVTLDVRRGDRFFLSTRKEMFTVTQVAVRQVQTVADAEVSERQ